MNAHALVQRLPGLAALVLGAWIWWYAGSFPELEGGYPGPALFPRLVALGLALCGMVLLWQPGDTAENGSDGAGSWAGRGRFAAGLVLVVAFPWLHVVIGFFFTTTLLALAVTLMLGARRFVAVVTAVVASGAVYLLFTRLLGVPL